MQQRELRDNEASQRIVERLIRIRVQRGLNQSAVAEALRARGHRTFTTPAIMNIESGRPRPNGSRSRALTVDELLAFADLYGLPPEDLIASPSCAACDDTPPAGFTCNTCQRRGVQHAS